MNSDDTVESGISRREVIRRGAIVGGTIAWAVPVVQSVGMSAAFGQAGSPACSCKVNLVDADTGECLAVQCDLSPSSCDCLRNTCSCEPVGCTCDFVTIVPGSCSPCP